MADVEFDGCRITSMRFFKYSGSAVSRLLNVALRLHLLAQHLKFEPLFFCGRKFGAFCIKVGSD